MTLLPLRRCLKSASYCRLHLIQNFMRNVWNGQTCIRFAGTVHHTASPAECVKQSDPVSNKHCFHQLTEPWVTSQELVSDLLAAKLYEDDNTVAFYKFNGIPMHALKYTENLPSQVLPPQTQELSVQDVVPLLEKAVGYTLYNVYSQPRLYGGVILFAKNKVVKQKLVAYFKNARVNRQLIQKYRVVSLGVPDPPDCRERFGLQRRKIMEHTLSVKVAEVSRKKRLSGDIITPTYELKTLDINRDLNCSLLEIAPSTTKWDGIQLLALHKLCPVLGDHMYGSRLQHMLDQPVLVSPSQTSPQTQNIPAHIVEKLGLRQNQCKQVPLHVYCSELTVPSLSRTQPNKTVTIRAKPDSFFQRTLSLLGLKPTD